jgi:hypothetical protein
MTALTFFITDKTPAKECQPRLGTGTVTSTIVLYSHPPVARRARGPRGAARLAARPETLSRAEGYRLHGENLWDTDSSVAWNDEMDCLLRSLC